MRLALTLKKRSYAGFTLYEVLLVVAIMAILAGIVIIAFNPDENLGGTRNAQRLSDVNAILNGIYQYSLDNGALPSDMPSTATEICATGATSCTNLVDLSWLTSGGKYLTHVPEDPQCPSVCATYGTGYDIQKDSSGRLTVTAPFAEEGKTISASR